MSARPHPVRFARRERLATLTVGAGVVVALVLAACTAEPTLPGTRPDTRGTDSLPPLAAVVAPTGRLERGDSLRIIVRDDRALAGVRLLVLDSASHAVVWQSATVAIADSVDTVTVGLAGVPADLAPGTVLQAVAWAADSAGHARVGNAPAVDSLNVALATPVALDLADGRVVAVGSTAAIGQLAPLGSALFFGDDTHNTLRAMNLRTASVQPWSVALGTDVATLSPAWIGVTHAAPQLVVGTAGASALTLLDVADTATATTAASITDSLPLDLVRLAYGALRVQATRAATAVLPFCLTPGCSRSSVLAAAPGVLFSVDSAVAADPASRVGVARTVRPTSAWPFQTTLFAPPYSPVLATDTASTMRLLWTNPGTAVDSTLATVGAASRCMTTALGVNPVAVSPDPAGALIVADSGLGLPECRTTPLVLRFEPMTTGGAQATVPSLVTHQQDSRFARIRTIVTNHDASRIAFVTEQGIRIADADFTILGTIGSAATMPAVLSVAFVVGDRATSGAWLAVSMTDRTIVVYDLDRMAPLTAFTTRDALASGLVFHRAADGTIHLVSRSADGHGFQVVETSTARIQARALQSAAARLRVP